MSHSHHIEVDFALLGKYLSGEAVPEEALAVDNWLLASEDNRRLYEQVVAVWQQGPQQMPHQLPHRETAWADTRAQWLRRYGRPSLAIRKYKRRLLAAASILAIIGTAAFFVLYRTKKPAAIAYISKEAGKGILRDTLPDNSVVVQNSHSLLKYPAGFTDRTRAISLAGEAWFEVKPDAARPFIIDAGDIQVKVVGTSFNIVPADSAIEVLVKTGAVIMYNRADSLLVKAGQKGIYSRSQQAFRLLRSFNVNDLGYATRVFNFDNVTLKEIAERIEKAYGITVVFGHERLKNLTMSSSFDNNTVQYVFDVISVTLNIRYRIDNKTVYISDRENN